MAPRYAAIEESQRIHRCDNPTNPILILPSFFSFFFFLSDHLPPPRIIFPAERVENISMNLKFDHVRRSTRARARDVIARADDRRASGIRS